MATRRQLLTSQEAADFLGISPRSLSRLISAKLIPFVKVGSKYMFTKKALEVWIELKKYDSAIEAMRRTIEREKMKLNAMKERSAYLENMLSMHHCEGR